MKDDDLMILGEKNIELYQVAVIQGKLYALKGVFGKDTTVPPVRNDQGSFPFLHFSSN